jgi:hypothetical protein
MNFAAVTEGPKEDFIAFLIRSGFSFQKQTESRVLFAGTEDLKEKFLGESEEIEVPKQFKNTVKVIYQSTPPEFFQKTKCCKGCRH